MNNNEDERQIILKLIKKITRDVNNVGQKAKHGWNTVKRFVYETDHSQQ